MLPQFLTPPTNPQEAIVSRRNPCYGFALIADIQEQAKLVSLLAKTRDKILEIVDPERATKQRPIRSPQYIKQKFFHAAVFGMQTLLEERQFIEIYANENGLLNHTSLDKMYNIVQTHLQEQTPYLLPLKFELMNNDGTILARFSYKTTGTDAAPLLSLTSQLDPEKKFAKWDPNNKLRYTTVTVAICVVDKDKMHEKLEAIQKQLELASQELIDMRRIDIALFRLINSYNKRTLSLKHISIYANITAEKIDKTTQEKTDHITLAEEKNTQQDTYGGFKSGFLLGKRF